MPPLLFFSFFLFFFFNLIPSFLSLFFWLEEEELNRVKSCDVIFTVLKRFSYKEIVMLGKECPSSGTTS